ncbi:uncharacterized protein LOC116349008 [Contarinia nasturtii]|uniref:uncharacterized protein LOC116349008 n=1 Tax=Contarinia nasturtii TaxID=265458 RepID=UPI0012D46BC6|nr:uncharacterized protein LOC116349008 [Contarinia nasturtii]
MKSILLLTLFSFFLFAKSEDYETIHSLVERFYGKALEHNCNLRPRLDFMYKFSKNDDKMIAKLKSTLSEFMDRSKIKEVLEKIPEEFRIKKKKARTVLKTKINLINSAQTDETKDLHDAILVEIAFELPEFYDDEGIFENCYKKWIHKSIDIQHLEQVKRDIYSMTSRYDTFVENFKIEMKGANNLTATIQTHIHLANDVVNQLLQASTPQIEKIANENVKPRLDKLSDLYTELFDILESVKESLEDYNLHRLRWAEFLIGMRSSHNSIRKSKDELDLLCQ